MSKKSKKDINIVLDVITNDLEKLEKCKNINTILKKHKNIKEKLEDTNDKINNLKKVFEKCEIEKQEISDDDFLLNINKINDITEDDFVDLSLEEQIDKYLELMKLINNSKDYLELKKIEIVNC
jgi:hypothetical protein